MNRTPFHSTPPSQPSPYRYLGRGGGERPVRLQIIIALVAGLVLVAVPLYLWRRPRPESIPSADAAIAADAGAPAPVSPVVAFDAGVAGGQLNIGKPETLKCQGGGTGKTPPERCDHITFFEDSLARAIRETAAAAPESKISYKVSYVMDVDFRRKKVTLFAGKSSTLKPQKLKGLVRDVKTHMTAPDEWKSILHQYGRYKVNVTVTYPPAADQQH